MFESIVMDFSSGERSRINLETERRTCCCGGGCGSRGRVQNILGVG